MQRRDILRFYVLSEPVNDLKTVSVAQMREADAYTIANFVPSRELMRRAAQGVFESACWRGHVAVVCGGGNNGGDGYALAGILAAHGVVPEVYQVSEKLSEDGAYYCERMRCAGIEPQPFTGQTSFDGFDIVVDCILGTGFTGEPRQPAKAAVAAINASGAYVISVDINSGMDGDTGEAVCAVRSDLTVSIGAVKRGLVTQAAKKYVGGIVNIDIGIVF